MLKILIFSLLISSKLFANTLQSTYYVNSNNIKLRDVFPEAKYDVTLYKIDYNRYSKRITSKSLVETLNKHGFKNATASSRYVTFVKKSPVDLSKIKDAVLNIYTSKYTDINISSVLITPRVYIKELPEKYQIILPKNAHLSNSGTLNIKTPKHQKIFFDYIIDAKLSVYVSKEKLKKGDTVSLLNTFKKNVYFEKFRASPVNEAHLGQVQMKKYKKQSSVITMKDIEVVDIVKRDSSVIVNLKDNNINISFSAKALQNGKLNDIIAVQKSSGQKLKVKVIGKNRVEIR